MNLSNGLCNICQQHSETKVHLLFKFPCIQDIVKIISTLCLKIVKDGTFKLNVYHMMIIGKFEYSNLVNITINTILVSTGKPETIKSLRTFNLFIKTFYPASGYH